MQSFRVILVYAMPLRIVTINRGSGMDVVDIFRKDSGFYRRVFVKRLLSHSKYERDHQ